MRIFTIIAAAVLIGNSCLGVLGNVGARIYTLGQRPEFALEPVIFLPILWGLFGHLLAILVGVLAIILAATAEGSVKAVE